MVGKKTFLVNVLDQCNFRCTYCYVAPRFLKNQKIQPIPFKTVETFFAKISDELKEIDTIDIIWHGGEPLLAGVKFYENIVDLEEKLLKNKTIINSMQTNGYLINCQWLDFFKDNNFKVGISLDGPEFLHNELRKKSTGKGTFNKVANSIKLLRDETVFGGIVTVITTKHVGFEKAVYETYKQLGIRDVKLNPLFLADTMHDKNHLAPAPKDLLNFYIGIYDIWASDGEPIRSINPLSELIQKPILGRSKTCIFDESCRHDFLTLTSTGDMYYCNRFASFEEFKVGNILTNKLQEMYAKKLQCVSKRDSKMCCPAEAYTQHRNANIASDFEETYTLLMSHLRQDIVKRFGGEKCLKK